MNISHFNDLLEAARQQTDAQRLLMVFAGAELSDDATPEQKADFDAGHGGELSPLMCADKTPTDIGSGEKLVTEAAPFGHNWVVVFVAGMSGIGPRAPSSEDAQAHLQGMVDAIKVGQIDRFIAFNLDGDAIQLN